MAVVTCHHGADQHADRCQPESVRQSEAEHGDFRVRLAAEIFLEAAKIFD